MRTATIIQFRPRPHPCDASRNLAAAAELALAGTALWMAAWLMFGRAMMGGR